MRPSKSPRLRGSVSQNNVSVRMRPREEAGISFLTRLSILGAALIVIVGLGILLWRSGWPQNKAQELADNFLTLTQKAQFSVKDVVVEGRHQSNRDDVFDALGTEQGAPILGVDTKTAAARLGKLPWVGSAVVERRLPDTVAVILTERVPAARWQHEDKIHVIDTDGNILPAARPEDFPGLPLVVGSGADAEAQNLFIALKSYPEIRDKIDSAVRVGERRWDLHLQSKTVIRLPEQDMPGALRRLSVLMAQERILDRNLIAVDLRLPDRLVVEPADANKPAGGPHP